VLTEERLDEIAATLEHFPQTSFRHLAQKTRVSKSSALIATKVLKLKPFKTTVVHELQPSEPTDRISFCNWILRFICDGEINSHLISFSDKASFRYIHKTADTGVSTIQN
jgi:hypothetical protein